MTEASRHVGKRRRLLHVFPGFALGGIQARFLVLARAFAGEFEHFVVATDGAWSALDPETEATCLIRRVPMPVARHTSWGNLRCIRRTIRDIAPDALFTYNWGAMDWVLANHWPGIPHVHAEDGFGPDEADRRLLRRNLLRALALRAARARVVTASHTLLEIGLREWRLPRQRIEFICNGIEPANYRPRPAGMSSRFARRPNELVIGTVSGLRPEKRIDRLVETVARLAPDFPVHLVIAGRGSEEAALRRRVGELGLEDVVTFLGFVDRPMTLYPDFDVFALLSDTEQLPIVILEAMAAGLPVLATDVGDVSRIVSAANAPFVVPRQVEAADAALRALLSDRVLRASVGAANLRHVRENFAVQAMLARWHDLFSGRH